MFYHIGFKSYESQESPEVLWSANNIFQKTEIFDQSPVTKNHFGIHKTPTWLEKICVFSKAFWGGPSYTPNFQPGLPYSFYHGRTGIVFNVNRNALGESLESSAICIKWSSAMWVKALKEWRHPLAIYNWLQTWKPVDLRIIFLLVWWSQRHMKVHPFPMYFCCRKLPLFHEFPSPDWWKMWKVAVDRLDWITLD